MSFLTPCALPPSFNFNMAKGYGNRGQRQPNRKDRNEVDGGAQVPKKFYVAKDKLAAYPDEDGCPFYLGDADDEKSMFSPGFLLSTRSATNEEYFHRLGMGLCLGASSLHTGMDALKDLVPAFWSQTDKDGTNTFYDASDIAEVKDKTREFVNKFAKTGFTYLTEFLHSRDGKKLLSVLEVLDVGREGRRDRKAAETAIRDFIDVLRTNGSNLRKHASRAASFAAKLYLAAMSIIEHLELFEHTKTWAKSMVDKAKETKEVKYWTKDPEDTDRLVDALCACFMEKIKTHGKEKGRRKRVADSSSEENASKASSNSSESSRERKKKKVNKRDDRRKKRNKSSESCSPSTSADGKKRAIKNKNTHEEKDKKRKRSVTPSPRCKSPASQTLKLDDWAVEEIHEFLAEAQMCATQKELAGTEAKRAIGLLNLLPSPIRKAYDLDYKNHLVLAKNAERAAEALEKCVADVVKAYKKSFNRSPPPVAGVQLSFSASEDDAEDTGERIALVDFTRAQSKTLIVTMEEALRNIDSKIGCLKIEELLTLLNDVPRFFLAKAELLETRQILSSRKRLPRKDQQRQIFEKTMEMARSIQALHDKQLSGLQIADTVPKDEGTKKSNLEEVFHLWLHPEAQQLHSQATKALITIGDGPKGTCKVDDIQLLMKQMPSEILATQPNLAREWKEAASLGPSVSNKVAKSIIGSMIHVAEVVNNCYDQQSLPASTSTTTEVKDVPKATQSPSRTETVQSKDVHRDAAVPKVESPTTKNAAGSSPKTAVANEKLSPGKSAQDKKK